MPVYESRLLSIYFIRASLPNFHANDFCVDLASSIFRFDKTPCENTSYFFPIYAMCTLARPTTNQSDTYYLLHIIMGFYQVRYAQRDEDHLDIT